MVKVPKKSKKNKVNVLVIIYAFLALGFMALAALIDWIYIVGALILIYLNKKELMK